MRGLIYLDGPDCSGKTTLANIIQAEVRRQGGRAVVRHLGKPEPGTAWDMHKNALISYIHEMQKDSVVIIDRHFLSEIVYGNVYREGSEYPFTAMYMEMLLDRFRALKVICCPPVEEVVRVHAEMQKVRAEEYVDKMDQVAKTFLQIWRGQIDEESVSQSLEIQKPVTPVVSYNYLFNVINGNGVQDDQLWHRYDYTKNTAEIFAFDLLQKLEHQQEYYNGDDEDAHFTGTASRLSTLFVTRSSNYAKGLHIPFFDNKDESLIFAKAASLTGHLDVGCMCIAGIDDPNGEATVEYLADRCKNVVVVGKHAERSLEDLGIVYHAFLRDPVNFLEENMRRDFSIEFWDKTRSL